jgi:cysteine desulfurase
MQRIYLDNSATTSLDPKVFKAMLLDLQGGPLNPSSVHFFGRQAKTLLQNAREAVASFFQMKPEEVIFTSGGTEGINTFLRGLSGKGHLITSTIEHSSIDKTAKALESQGMSVTYLPVGSWGAPLPEHIEKAIRPDTKAIALSGANSETGVKIDLEAIASIAKAHDIPLLIDAVSWIGKEDFPSHPGITAIALSAHKFHGPKGIGALLVRTPFRYNPLSTGGMQEMQKRAGTENLAGILGLQEALHLVSQNQRGITQHIEDLRKHLEYGLLHQIPDLCIHGEGPRIASTANFGFPGVDGEDLFMQLDMAGIAVSLGSACSSGSIEPSRVLLNMGVPTKLAKSSLRFSVGRMNTREEIEIVIEKTATIVTKLRHL